MMTNIDSCRIKSHFVYNLENTSTRLESLEKFKCHNNLKHTGCESQTFKSLSLKLIQNIKSKIP